MLTIFTIGHSTHPWPVFLAMLRAFEVDCLVDVRHYPSSRRYPQYNRDALQAALADAGIDYVHEVELGGRRAPRPDSPNDYWRIAQFRGYADHQNSPSYRGAIERLIERAQRERPAIMCAEAVPWRCHRQLIADDLTLRGCAVRHILSATKDQPHTLNAAIKVDGEGRFHYAAEESSE